MPKNKRIVEAVSKAKGELLSATQIAEAAAVPPGERKALQQRLRDLTMEGILEREGRRFRIAGGAGPVATPKAGAAKKKAGPARAKAGTTKAKPERADRNDRARAAVQVPKAPALVEAIEVEQAAAQRAREISKVYGERRGEVVGLLTLRPEGYGFVKRLEGPPGEDVFLPPHELRDAMNGDKVRVRVVHGKFGRDAGVLLEIVAHRRQQFLGVYGSRGQGAFVVPVDPTLPRLVPVKAHRTAKQGQVVKVIITEYPSATSGLRGEIERVVGEPDDPIIEVLEVAYAHGFAEEFPAAVRAEAARVPDKVRASERQGRRDLTSLPLVTIDSEDARDFDDAVCVERLPRGGYRLVVAIADVAHYVQLGSSLDDEAFARATSVYFPNHVLPMLPEKLSNGICSLNPEVERLCMVADLALDASGKPVEVQLYEGVMSSHARLTYDQVARVLRGETPEEIDHLEEDLLLAGELASKLRAQRKERGALDFDLPEARAILNDQMLPTSIERRERNDAHRLIEEFMLAANEAVARHFSDRDLPTVYRVHDQPDPEKLERFANLAEALGFHFDVRGGVTPKRLAELLREIEGSPQQQALNSLLLRSLMQALYQPENIGHYGLASEHYLHFTSPIRRYPDLVVHRLLKEHWARAGRIPRGSAREAMEERLGVIAAQASERERAATEAERDIDQYFKCLFIEDRVGETFAATVIALTDFGFFAELDEVPVEGLVRADELGSHWELDEARYRLVYPGTGRSFGMGDKVKVEVAGVDLEKRQVSLRLLVDQQGADVISERKVGKPGRSPLASAVDKLRRAGAPAPRTGPQGRQEVKDRGAGRERAAGEERGGRGKQQKGGAKKRATATKQRPGKRERSQKR